MREHSVILVVVLAIRDFNKQIIMQPDFRKRSPRGGVRRQERSLKDGSRALAALNFCACVRLDPGSWGVLSQSPSTPRQIDRQQSPKLRNRK